MPSTYTSYSKLEHYQPTYILQCLGYCEMYSIVKLTSVNATVTLKCDISLINYSFLTF